MTNTTSRGLKVLALILGLAGILQLISHRMDGGPALQHQWKETVEAGDPLTWLSFLAERQPAEAGWDWRKLPDPARHIWASVQFELLLPDPPEPTDDSPNLPTYAEAADAYTAMDLGEAARLVDTMRDHRATRQAQGGRAWTVASTRLTAMRAQLQAGRSSYAQAHQAELDRLFPVQ